ncbi:hypothetical protein ACWC5I_28560 [Kitasatospora sp. NPDC001574]
MTHEQIAETVRKRIKEKHGRDTSIDGRAVGRLERGAVTWPRQDYREALCWVFGVETPAEIGLYCKKARPTTQELSPSHRRTLMTASLAAALPPQIAGPPRRLTLGYLGEITERIRILEDLDRHNGGAATRHFAFTELRAVVQLTEASMGPQVRARLHGAIAELADLAAWSSFDAGKTKESRPLFRLGMHAAREAQDPSALCHLATNLARQEINQRNPEAALALTEVAAQGTLPNQALAVISAIRAQAHALKGEEPQMLRCIHDAEALYARVTDLENGPAWMRTINPGKLTSDTGFALYLHANATGRYAPQLLSQLRTAAETLATRQPRARALGAARAATVLYHRGERDEADHWAAAAAEVATTVRSARLQSALVEMRNARRGEMGER